ncbi:hypothetical protein MJG53_009316 [Ovis ammon polii x Ovis aries]|uniref:Uncharacterized protein n=1 Tax=Ovis ammon polii x Ovis aries TaxID=2918886 RepID=A0ACB9UW01_9CETA|nr:hypothetical protein MJG53_009316 [Ovis ammon polii x Ovis aries]
MLARQKESEATGVMKGPLLVLLVLVLCAELAQSLRCYSCGTLGKFSVPNHCPTSECDSNSTVCYTGNLSMIVEAAYSLVCFTCQDKQSNWGCLKPTICSDTDSYCVTVSASAGLKNVVNLGYSLYKFCSPICGSTSLNLGLASMDTSCCQSFLCNISAAGRGPRASAPVLGLGLLLSLLAALLRFGP